MALFTDKCVRLCELGLGVINYETKLTILDVFLILQEYVNHGAVLYKVTVVAQEYGFLPRERRYRIMSIIIP